MVAQEVKAEVQKDIGKSLAEVSRFNKDLLSNVEFEHRNAAGELLGRYEMHNIIVSVGKALMAALITSVGGTAFSYIAIGTGTAAETVTDTALQTEISSGGGSRASASCDRVTTTYTNDTARLVLTYNFLSSFAVTESGVFNAGTSGTMLCRKTFSAINANSGDSLQVTWKVQMS